MKKQRIVAVAILGALSSPLVAFALNFSNYTVAIQSIATLIDAFFGILLALAVFMVAWGIFKFILNAGDEGARKEGRSMIFWGVVGIFIMVSIWGLVNLLKGTIELNNTAGNVPGILPTGVLQPQAGAQQAAGTATEATNL